MKKPKKTKRYCPVCKKHTDQKVAISRQGGRSSAHPLSKFSTARLRMRGKRRGYGNLGKYSKPAIKSWKRKTKSTKKFVMLYTCTVCNKSTLQRKGVRTTKVVIEDKNKK